MGVPYYGDFAEDATVRYPFNTFDSNDPSGSVTITELADSDLHVHKDGSVTQIVTDGATVVINFDSITGGHMVTIDTSAHADYSTGSDYAVRMEGTAIDGGTVNAWLFTFSIENRFSAAQSALILTDTEAVQTDTEAVIVDTEALLVDTEAIIIDTEAIRTDAANIIIDTEAAITERSTLLTDTEALLVDTEAIIIDTEAIRTDAAAIIIDTEAAITARSTLLTDTEALLVDTEAVIIDTEAIRTDAAAILADTEANSLRELGLVLHKAAIESVTSTTVYVIPATDDAVDDDAYNGMVAVFIDQADANQVSVRDVTDYDAGTRSVTVSSAPDFTVVASDILSILPTNPVSVTAVLTDTEALLVDTEAIIIDTEAATGVIADTEAIITDTENVVRMIGVVSTISSYVDDQNFDITAGVTVDDEFNGWGALIIDQSDGAVSLRKVTDSVASTNALVLNANPASSFTYANSDILVLLPAFTDETDISSILTDTEAIITDTEAVLVDTEANVLRELGLVLHKAAIESVTSTTVYVIPATDDATDDDAYNDMIAVFIDQTDANQVSVRRVTDYDAGTRSVTVDSAPVFTVVASDILCILPTNPASVAAILTDTEALLVDTEAIIIDTEAATGVIADTEAIKTETDKFVFTNANELDVNTKSINDAEVVGDGNATPWDGA